MTQFSLFKICSLKVKQSRWEAVPFQRASEGSVSRGGKTTSSASRARGGHRLGHYRNIFSQRSPSSSSSRSSSRSPSPSNSRYRDHSNQRHRRRWGSDRVRPLFGVFLCREIKRIVISVPAILVHSLIAAFQATSDLSCHDGIRGGDRVVATTESEGEETEDVGEGRPTEEDGKWRNSDAQLWSDAAFEGI